MKRAITNLSNFTVRLILAVVGVAVLVTVAVVSVGAVAVHSSDDEVNITIDKGQLRERAQQEVKNAQETGRAVMDRTGEALRNAGEEIRTEPEGTKAPATGEPPSPQQ